MAHVLYTDFHLEGKIAEPEPESLAIAAILSVSRAKPGKDGISYLIDLMKSGVDTALTTEYVASILSQTGAHDLEAALKGLETPLGGHKRD